VEDLMAHELRSHVRLILAGVLPIVCLTLVSFIPTSSPTSPNCEELRRWAARSYDGQRPPLDHVASFDRPHRVAIFNAIAPAARAELWREQLRRFAQRPDLRDAQRSFIVSARAELSPATYAQDDVAARRLEVRRFWARAEPLFPTAEHRRVWFELGPGVVRGQNSRIAVLRDRMIAPFRAFAQPTPCDCNPEWGWVECHPGSCVGVTCNVSWSCGPEGRDICGGVCG
jgi:hypothetical protein